jgi:hypothetical protein
MLYLNSSTCLGQPVLPAPALHRTQDGVPHLYLRYWRRQVQVDGQSRVSEAQVVKHYTPENWKTWIVSLDGSSQLDVSGYTGLGQVLWRP